MLQTDLCESRLRLYLLSSRVSVAWRPSWELFLLDSRVHGVPLVRALLRHLDLPPRPIPTRPSFSTTVQPGTGFPPSSRVGQASRTRSARGPAPFRSSRIHAPFTVDIPGDSDSASDYILDPRSFCIRADPYRFCIRLSYIFML